MPNHVSRIETGEREALAKLIDDLLDRPLWKGKPYARLAFLAAARTIRRGRHLTAKEQLANLQEFLDEPDVPLPSSHRGAE